MHKALLGALLAWSLAVAGCSGGSGGHDVEDVTCPDGSILTSKQNEDSEHHHDAGYNATSLCPVAPKVVLSGLPTTIQVYDSASFTWAVSPGSVEHGHSMLTSIRYAKASIPDLELVEGQMEKYPTEIIKKEHQDLPVTFKGNMTFNQPGTVYIRAYAQVQGKTVDGADFPRRDVWSPEVVLEVLPVQPSGREVVITHSTGFTASNLDGPTDPILIGDALRFNNAEVLELTLTQTSAPDGAPACELTAGPSEDSAETCLLIVPGTYEFETNDVPQKKTVTISVTKG